ncbi:MAG: hypothetical protein AT707_01800 [Pyrobaculum sp. JCHS_4]|nr:MAG: hypothetical protein AT707_01800 [Pyrobaculum sp. JCHS_4]
MEELRKKKALLSLGASSLLGPPEDLSTVEELKDPISAASHSTPTTTVGVRPCTVAVAEVVQSTEGDPFRLADFSHIAPIPVAA